jgi:hypothetical protein
MVKFRLNFYKYGTYMLLAKIQSFVWVISVHRIWDKSGSCHSSEAEMDIVIQKI